VPRTIPNESKVLRLWLGDASGHLSVPYRVLVPPFPPSKKFKNLAVLLSWRQKRVQTILPRKTCEVTKIHRLTNQRVPLGCCSPLLRRATLPVVISFPENSFPTKMRDGTEADKGLVDNSRKMKNEKMKIITFTPFIN
jgi:hypothetical protein